MPDPIYLATAVEIVLRAGDIQREGQASGFRVAKKGSIDLVTEVDLACERMCRDLLAERFPDHDVLAEEGGARSAAPGARVRWLVDPLDGTTNFAHNYPFFAVSIAAERDGERVAAVVFDPVRDELFAAARGEGATRNGEPIQVSACARLEDALLVTGFPYDVREHPDRHVPLFQAFLVRAQGIRRDGSAALNLAYVAMGRFDGMWEGNLAPWDVAAGSLLVEEAGGRMSVYDGGPFRVDGRQVCGANPRLHALLLERIAAHPEAHRRA